MIAVPLGRAAGLAALVGWMAASVVSAQPAPTLTGRVLDAFSMRPVSGAAVEGGGLTVVSDSDGRFALALPRGLVRLSIAAAGYLTEHVDVVVGDAAVAIEVLLLDQTQFKEEVVVTGAYQPAAASPATIEVTPLQVRSIAGAAENVFKALQTLPGVAATDDFGSRLAVRGGGPDQNLTVMDGVEIHNPYRLFGLTSAFNPETVQDFELTAGGFSAKYGDRLSSILLVENRAGTDSRAVAGSVSLTLTDANAIVEGRLPGRMKGSWLVTGRRTYYDLAAERFTDSDLPSFADLQAKVAWELAPGRRVTFFALRSRESADAAFDDEVGGSSLSFRNASRNDLVSASFSTAIGSRVTTRSIVSWYRYGDALDFDGSFRSESTRSNAPGDEAFGRAAIVFTRDLRVRDLSVRHESAVRASETQIIEAGFETHALETRWGWTVAGDRNLSEANGSSARGGAGLPSFVDSSRDTVRLGAWVIDRIRLSPRVSLEPGLRFDWDSLSAEAAGSPRVSGVVALGGSTRLRGAAGLFTQSPGYEKLLQSDYFVDLTAPEAGGIRSERSVHVIGALEHDVRPGLTVRVEAYHKSFDRLIVGRVESAAETAARVAQYDFPQALASSVPSSPQITSTPVNGAGGRAYGFDLFVAHRPVTASGRLSGWASYTWGRAEIGAYGRRYPFDYDRRHALSLVGTYRATRLLELAATIRVASGFPYTPVKGLRVAASALPAGVTGEPDRYVPKTDAGGLYVWTTDAGTIDDLNSARLPAFVRVDVRATFRPSWAGSRWQFYVEVINALNRKNASGVSSTLEYDPSSDRPRLVTEPRSALPLLPSFGVRFRF